MKFCTFQKFILVIGAVLILFTGRVQAENQNLTSPPLLQIQEALSGVLSEPLQLVGTFIHPNSESGKVQSCLFRNKTVTVFYDYCTRPELPALGLVIHLNNSIRGLVRLYIETDGVAVSQLKRSDIIDVLFYLNARENGEDYRDGLTAQQYRSYLKSEMGSSHYGCLTSNNYGSAPMNTRCQSDYIRRGADWAPSAEEFWNQLSKDLRPALQAIQKKIPKLN